MLLVLLTACHNRGADYQQQHEDKQAKEMLQGLWTNGENSDPAMLVKGDSIFYPDSASMPVRFWIYQDTIYLQGQNIHGYKIEKQAAHLLKFANQNGDEVKLIKSNDKALYSAFNYHVYAMNTFLEQSQDTVIRTDLGYFQSKVHVQTTSDKVVKSTYNDNGVEVDNIYLDNVASLRLYNMVLLSLHMTSVNRSSSRLSLRLSSLVASYVRCISRMLMPKHSTTMLLSESLMPTQHTLSN